MTIDPNDTGMIDVGDGHSVYWEECGNPDGIPVVYLHGGPGAGASVGQRAFFDPARYRGVIFDQRGSGRSRPLASAIDADLSANTTQHLIGDIEMIRKQLGIERWGVLGMSWGSTLALAYSQAHPDRVLGVTCAMVTTTSRREVDWITEGVGRLFPEAWHRFASWVPERLSHLRVVDAYAELLVDPDQDVSEQAAIEWCRWEDTHVSLAPGFRPHPLFSDPEFRLRFARLVTHYWSNSGFLSEDQILRDAATLDGIPGVLIHGRYDVSLPLQTPWELSRRWSTGRLYILEDAGHDGGPNFMEVVADALLEVT